MPDSPLQLNYPASLDTVVSGGEVANRAFTTLSNTITDTALSIPLTDSTVFPSTGVITLTDSLTAPTKTEDIIYTANSANTLTVLTGGRGAFGSTAQNWSGTVYVRMRMMAEHHEFNRDAVIALETKLGYTASTPTNGKFLAGSTTAGTSAWRVLTSGDIPDLSATYEPANANIQAHIASTSNPHSVTKSQVGLGSVENTALSTWAGSTNLTTLGTISAGTWNGAVIDEDYGGAGSINGILKANGSGTVSAAVSGTDYLSVTAPGSSGQLIYNNAGAYAAASKILYGSNHVAMGATAVINDRSLLYPLDASVNAVLSIQETFTSGLGATPTAQAITAHVLANPASSGMLVNGLDVEVFSQSGNSQSMAGMVGHISYVQHNGSGTVSIAAGTQATVENAGSGTIPYAYGTFFSIANLSTGVITDAAAIAMYPPYDNGAGGHILNSYGMLIQAGGGDVRNQYGIYISDLSSFGSVSTFNLYSAGATAVNYFQGIVRALDVCNTTAAAGSVGSATLPFKYFYLAGDSGTPGTNNFKLTGTATAARTITFQDGSGTVAFLSDIGASGANAALSNLSGVSINASLIPQTTLNLGAQATPWKNLWLYGGGTFGTHSIKLDGTPTGHRTVTFPDATDTVAVLGTAQTFTAIQTFNNGVTTGTGATAGTVFTYNSLTTGNGVDISSSSVTSGNLVKITSTSTAAASSTLTGLNIAISGANGTTAQTVTGERISVTNTNGTSGTNIGLLAIASGATSFNWAAQFQTGFVGFNLTGQSTGRRAWAFDAGSGSNEIAFRRYSDNFAAAVAAVWSVDNSVATDTFNMKTAVFLTTSGTSVASNARTPAQITSDQNNYSPGIGSVYRLSSDASRNITGFTTTANTDGAYIELWNVGSNNIVLVNESASSTAANRFTTTTGADLTLVAGKCALGRYDATTSRWRVRLGN